MSGARWSTGMADRSAHSKCGVERLAQSFLSERLGQALHRPLREHAWTDGLIHARGDEYDRDLLPATHQFLLEIEARHARHGDVEDQTSGLTDAIGREELFRRRERPGRKAKLPQQIG